MLNEIAAKDFTSLSAQLSTMTSLQLQAFLNYLSSRLRMMSCIIFTRQWLSEEEYLYFQDNCMEELVCKAHEKHTKD